MFKSFVRTIVLFSFLVFTLSRCALFTEAGGVSGPRNPSRAGTSTHTDTRVETVTPKRKEVVDFAKKQLGAKYRAGGKSPGGFDCSGLTYYVMKNFDVTLSPSSRYQAKEGKKIRVEDAQPGDLIFFKRSAAGEVFHVAMVVRNTREGIEVIHSTSRGVVIDNISKSSYWEPKIYSAREVL
ncbi:MAG: C40 family peptidase [Lewinellaceae bacterium]|nr:C40 family peptidase [Phaeodactylibacter sp.]MCB0616095.1 C40 family peptidase [Phaeodactylibacter sp.]MCB9348189.1 C40 family peptidase [Lewinellaceae bacterium]